MADEGDELLSVLPIHFSAQLAPHLHLHQYPLQTRDLVTPPSAVESGKRIRARHKPQASRFEVQVPIDIRPEVWNADKGRTYGVAREEEDQEEAMGHDVKMKQKEPQEMRLSEVRLLSERVSHNGEYVLGVVRHGVLHLHPIAQTHQLRPSLTYLDVIAKHQSAREKRRDSDDEDDEPPPDPDEAPPVTTTPKKEKKTLEAKEVQVTARKADESGQALGGMTQLRRDMLTRMRAERDEEWEGVEWCDVQHPDSIEDFEKLFSKNEDVLKCTSSMSDMLTGIKGLR